MSWNCTYLLLLVSNFYHHVLYWQGSVNFAAIENDGKLQWEDTIAIAWEDLKQCFFYCYYWNQRKVLKCQYLDSLTGSSL